MHQAISDLGPAPGLLRGRRRRRGLCRRREVEAGELREPKRREDFLIPLTGDFPGRVGVDARSPALARLSRTLRAHAALDVGQPLGGSSEQRFLILAMGHQSAPYIFTPLSAMCTASERST